MSKPAQPTSNLHSDLPSASSAQGFMDRKELSAMAFERTRMPMVMVDAQASDHPIVLANKSFLDLTGYTAEEVVGRNCRFLQFPETSPTAVSEIRQVLRGERTTDVEILNYRKDGSAFWNRLHLSPIRDDDEQLLYYFGSQIDVTEYRKVQSLEATEHRLLKEIDHRTKNALAIVESIVRLSNKEDPARYAKSIQDRVQALALAHTMLSENGWRHVALEELTRQQIAPYGLRQVTLHGPGVMLPALIVQPISLVIHELAMNAAQHGALQHSKGKLHINWNPEDEGFALQWIEVGGSSPAAPLKPGFGTVMINALVEKQLGGRVERVWGHDKLEISLRVRTGS